MVYFLTVFQHSHIKMVKWRVQNRLTVGILRRQFPSWFNYVSSTVLSTTFAFQIGNAGDGKDAGGNKADGIGGNTVIYYANIVTKK